MEIAPPAKPPRVESVRSCIQWMSDLGLTHIKHTLMHVTTQQPKAGLHGLLVKYRKVESWTVNDPGCNTILRCGHLMCQCHRCAVPDAVRL